MKHIAQRFLMLFAALTVAVSLSSCEDEEDWRAEQIITGSWRITEISFYGGECPYYEGDRMDFYANGELRVYGAYDFYEEGYWDVHNGHLYIDFNYDGVDDIRADICSLDYGYIRLDVNDYSYNSRYTLRLIKR